MGGMSGLALPASRPHAVPRPRPRGVLPNRSSGQVWTRFWRWFASVDGRAFRVVALVGVIAALSVIDLYLTVLYVSHTGMAESNPIARLVLRHGSLASVAAFKLGTVALCGFILCKARRRASAELGAIACAVAMTLLTAQWLAFSQEQHRIVQQPSLIGIEAMFEHDQEWVRRDDLLPPRGPRAGIIRVW